MLRRLLVIVSLLALVMAVVSPALADDESRDRDTARPTVTVTPTATAKAATVAEDEETDTELMGKAFQGIVVKVDGDNLIVKNAKFASDLTVTTDENTIIRWPKGIVKQTIGTTPKLADFVPGDRVVVKLAEKPTDTSKLLARAIYLVPGQTFVHVTGTVTAATADTLSVQSAQGVKKFAVADTVQVRTGHETAPYDPADFKAGVKVTVVARANAATGQNPTAYSIAVHGQNNGKADTDKEKGNQGVGQGKGQAGDDEDQTETEDAVDNGQPHGKAVGHDKANKNGKP